MSKTKKTETTAAFAGLVLVAIAPPSLAGFKDVDKALEKLGHKLVPPFDVAPNSDDQVLVPEVISNLANIMIAPVDGVLLCPNWVGDPVSRVEVFAAVTKGLKMYALGTDGALVEIDSWAAIMTLASHEQFKEAQAIYAPLPGSSRAG